MKILNIIAQVPAKTGSGIYFRNTVKKLEELGHENAIIFGANTGYEDEITSLYPSFPVYFDKNKDGMNVLGMSEEMPYLADSYFSLDWTGFKTWAGKFEETLLFALSNFRPDIIISHHLFLLTSLVRDVWRGPLVGISHGTDLRNILKSKTFQKMTRNIKDLDLIFSLSKSQKEDIEEFFDVPEEKAKVLGGGYREEIFKPGPKDIDKIKVVYAGKFSKAKGVYELIEAMKKIDVAELILIGAKNDDELSKFKFLTRNLDAKVYKQMPQEKLAEIFAGSHIFVLPSYYEGLGLVCIEALASGMKVVTSEIRGLEELLGEEVIDSFEYESVSLPRLRNLDEPYEEDLDAYIKRLRDAIKIMIVRTYRGERSDIRENIEQHSWKNIAKKIERELELVLNKKI